MPEPQSKVSPHPLATLCRELEWSQARMPDYVKLDPRELWRLAEEIHSLREEIAEALRRIDKLLESPALPELDANGKIEFRGGKEARKPLITRD